MNTNCLASIVAIDLQHLQLFDWGVLTTDYQKTKDIVKNYHSYCKAQAKNDSLSVEFSKSLKESLFDNIPELQYVQNDQSGNITMSATQLKKILTKKLSSTYVRVFPVPINVMDRLYFII